MGSFDWYYNPKRWEHRTILDQINENLSVLEVGSGMGAFLDLLKSKNINCVGLELNSNAVLEGICNGLNMLLDPVDKYAIKNKEKHDVVCSFQVLEHVPDPFSFIESSLLALKKGGKLIIAVPNNDSYISNNHLYSKVLNMPPHHMGMWDKVSLKALEKIFPITLESFMFEPLVGSNVDVYLWNKTYTILFKSKFLTNSLWKIRFHYLLRYLIKFVSHKIKGQTIIAIYIKK